MKVKVQMKIEIKKKIQIYIQMQIGIGIQNEFVPYETKSNIRITKLQDSENHVSLEWIQNDSQICNP